MHYKYSRITYDESEFQVIDRVYKLDDNKMLLFGKMIDDYTLFNLEGFNKVANEETKRWYTYFETVGYAIVWHQLWDNGTDLFSVIWGVKRVE